MLDQMAPSDHVRRTIDVQLFVEDPRKAFLFEDERDFVNIFHVETGYDGFRLYVTKI